MEVVINGVRYAPVAHDVGGKGEDGSAKKGTGTEVKNVQSDLQGTRPPQATGTIRGDQSGSLQPVTGGVKPLGSTVPAGRSRSSQPGVTAPLQGGESAYVIIREDEQDETKRNSSSSSAVGSQWPQSSPRDQLAAVRDGTTRPSSLAGTTNPEATARYKSPASSLGVVKRTEGPNVDLQLSEMIRKRVAKTVKKDAKRKAKRARKAALAVEARRMSVPAMVAKATADLQRVSMMAKSLEYDLARDPVKKAALGAELTYERLKQLHQAGHGNARLESELLRRQ